MTAMTREELDLCGEWVDRWLNGHCTNAEFDQLNPLFCRYHAAARKDTGGERDLRRAEFKDLIGDLDLYVPTSIAAASGDERNAIHGGYWDGDTYVEGSISAATLQDYDDGEIKKESEDEDVGIFQSDNDSRGRVLVGDVDTDRVLPSANRTSDKVSVAPTPEAVEGLVERLRYWAERKDLDDCCYAPFVCIDKEVLEEAAALITALQSQVADSVSRRAALNCEPSGVQPTERLTSAVGLQNGLRPLEAEGLVVDTSDEACAVACMLVSNPLLEGETIRTAGWQKRVNDLIRALRDERNALQSQATHDRRIHCIELDKAQETIAALQTEKARLGILADPPIARRQFPDGSVPGNGEEAAIGWRKFYEEAKTQADAREGEIALLKAAFGCYVDEQKKDRATISLLRAVLKGYVNFDSEADRINGLDECDKAARAALKSGDA